MRQIAQIALTRTDAERQQYLQGFHHGHAEREPGSLDSFVRWAYSDPRVDAVPALLAEIERPEEEYAGALIHEAETLVRTRGEGRTPAQRVADYLGLLGTESSEAGAGDAGVAPARRHARERRHRHHPPDAPILARHLRGRPVLCRRLTDHGPARCALAALLVDRAPARPGCAAPGPVSAHALLVDADPAPSSVVPASPVHAVAVLQRGGRPRSVSIRVLNSEQRPVVGSGADPRCHRPGAGIPAGARTGHLHRGVRRRVRGRRPPRPRRSMPSWSTRPVPSRRRR